MEEEKMIDGRGQYMVKRKERTAQAIKDYISANPNAIRKDICEAVGVTYTTLRTHLKALQK